MKTVIFNFKGSMFSDLAEIKRYFVAAIEKNPAIKQSPAYTNYLFDNNPGSLERAVRDGRFNDGEYIIITDNDDQLVVGSGYYRLNGIVMAGIRLLMAPPDYSYKRLPLFSGVMLPALLERTPGEPHVFTFNEYNTRLMNHIFVVAKENKKKLVKNDPLFAVALEAIQPFTVSSKPWLINFTKQNFVFDKFTEEEIAAQAGFSPMPG